MNKNIPIPNIRKRGFNKKRKEFSGKYKWWLMKPGDSFFVKRQGDKSISSLQSHIYSLAVLICKNNKLNWVFTTKVDHKKDGVRIWRVK